jgi:Sigma 54 modulation/S30EA ribosomal protein C terminus
MRRAADRKRVHRGRHTPVSVARALAGVEAGSVDVPLGEEPPASTAGPIAVDGEGPLVVRTKTHAASPMTLDQALYEMELVGHDFFLFIDKESERPSVVYRRRGYDYGVISLDVS